MYNRIFPIGSLFLVFLLFIGCLEEKLPPLPRPNTPRLVRPQGGDEKIPPVKASEEPYPLLAEQDLTPKAPLEPGEKLLKVINLNLDLDRQEEQILIFRGEDSMDSTIHIAVLDYEEVIKDYRRTWKGSTLATDIRSFSVSLADLIGDHNLEIICAGMSSDNRQSLTIFRKTKQANKTGLFYTDILRLRANGTIEILEITRSHSYEAGMTSGKRLSHCGYGGRFGVRKYDGPDKVHLLLGFLVPSLH